MEKIKILSIFGTRPEAIKMIPLIKVMEANNKIESITCVTAQHRELLDEVLDAFNIKPNYDLNLMKERQSLTELTAEALKGIEKVIQEVKPDWVLVHGDTATALSASLAAFYNKVSVGHVEAGLRSYDKYQPFPEEINRKVATAIADLHFAPTELAKKQLKKENIPHYTIFVTGNTVIDIMKYTIKDNYTFVNPHISNLDMTGKKIILLTAHRRENWGMPLKNICNAVRKIADDFHDALIIYPVHPNPTVKEMVQPILSDHERIILTDPLNIFDMHNLISKSYLILTDSGGLQEEAPSQNKPVVVLREVTERPEGAKAGTLILAGTNEERIYNAVKSLFTDNEKYTKMAEAENPFGDGHASERIVDTLVEISRKKEH